MRNIWGMFNHTQDLIVMKNVNDPKEEKIRLEKELRMCKFRLNNIKHKGKKLQLNKKRRRGMEEAKRGEEEEEKN